MITKNDPITIKKTQIFFQEIQTLFPIFHQYFLAPNPQSVLFASGLADIKTIQLNLKKKLHPHEILLKKIPL